MNNKKLKTKNSMNNKNPSEDEITIDPKRTCDVVMKGGITSGIVYPKGIYELAKKYRFRNIGGNSAGAIAACLTAAAEYDRRENKSTEGFRLLNKLHLELGKKANGKTKLFSLFQPNKSTRKVFNTLLKLFELRSSGGKLFFGAVTLIKHYLITTILAALPGIIIIILSWLSDASILFKIFLIGFTLFSTILIVSVTLLIKFVYDSNKCICKNSFGLTRGFIEESKNSDEPLTEWLADTIDKVAGRKKDPSEPLTFGNLENSETGQHDINLRMITTNLTWGRPHTMPFENDETKNVFYYDPKELRKYFPERIVKWMDEKSPDKKHGKYRLPEAGDLPIVVAARMSLCFPILISTIPLYAVDYSLKENRDNPDAIPEKCIFSDGGICSNFPVHLFDSPLPSRPTFAFTLNQFHRDYPQSNEDESKNIYLPDGNGGGITGNWNRNINSLMKFVFSIIDTMQNWNDNTLSTIPGYRDRIVQIHLNNDEGGLNLNMENEVMDKLSERGKFAGKILRETFIGQGKSKLDWNNHRWIRFRTSMCLLEDYLERIEKSFKIDTSDIERSYIDLMKRSIGEVPASYQFTSTQRDFAIEKVKKIRELANEFLNNEISFCRNKDAPKPQPELRIRPRV